MTPDTGNGGSYTSNPSGNTHRWGGVSSFFRKTGETPCMKVMAVHVEYKHTAKDVDQLSKTGSL
jgi:hypothetical protein